MLSRRRLSSEESRAVALDAARTLLIESGPQGVTLKAVAHRIDRTHANLLHHFGSAAGMQRALALHLADLVCASIGDAVRATRAEIGEAREVVDLTFDAFGRNGGGALASWMLATGNKDALDPIVGTVQSLMQDVQPGFADLSYQTEIRELTLALILLALGDALLGELLCQTLSVSRSSARDRAEEMVEAAFAKYAVSPTAAA